MDIYRLSTDSKFLNQLGQALRLDERMKLQIGLQKLSDFKPADPADAIDQVLFWGKIEGTNGDYYIAVGLQFNVYEFPKKKFFWSGEDFNFEPLPELNPEYKDKVDTFKEPFKGEAKKILIEVEAPQGDDAPNPDDDAQPQDAVEVDPLADTDDEKDLKKAPKNFYELDRLSYVVRAIDFECAALPVGAVKLTSEHQLRYNDTFKGLSQTDAAKITSYQHFRAPITEEKQEFIMRPEAVLAYDFLDPLSTDLPKGSWSIHTDSSKTEVTVRNLVWPGYMTYHKTNTNVFGFCYFGDGLKNNDLPFLV